MKKSLTELVFLIFAGVFAASCDRIPGIRELAKYVIPDPAPKAEELNGSSSEPDATAEVTERKDLNGSSSMPSVAAEVTEQKSGSVQNTAADKTSKEILEGWKAKAVAEFPELGVAGSKFNQAFLAEVKRLRGINGAEIGGPDWPYIVALQVNTQIEREKLMAKLDAKTSDTAKTSPESARVTGVKQPAPRAVNLSQTDNGGFGSYRASDLKTMQIAPKGGKFNGVITKIEKPLSSRPLEITITLDGFLPCEINLDRPTPSTKSSTRTSTGGPYYPYDPYDPYYYSYYYRYSSSKSNTSLNLTFDRDRSTATLSEVNNSWAQSSYTGRVYSNIAKKDVLTLSIGQAVTVQGIVLLKSNQKPMLKGILATE
jgi:hypothetical protein